MPALVRAKSDRHLFPGPGVGLGKVTCRPPPVENPPEGRLWVGALWLQTAHNTPLRERRVSDGAGARHPGLSQTLGAMHQPRARDNNNNNNI